jgi:acetylornithine/succinyldiaminopimelate/putrescine aminotransferase
LKTRSETRFVRVSLSLEDILGPEYIDAVLAALEALAGGEARAVRAARATATRRVDFFPAALQRRLVGLLPRTGEVVGRSLTASTPGATSAQFRAHTVVARSPLSGLGYFRVGEDGRLYLASKSEHYHASLGHAFPGYRLIEHARRIGVQNATHNSTRGFITRRLEEELVRSAAGIPPGDRAALDGALSAGNPTVLNRVLNLETGSLAAEAAIKMLLNRFYRSQPESPEGAYRGRVPVFLVMGSDRGGLQANYHGTTVLAQAMRGMWPELLVRLEEEGILAVRAVRPNDVAELEAAFLERDRGREKIAGFLHELVLMNYGARRLTETYVKRAYALCAAHDVPVVVDEIQTCVWSPRIFMYREYGVEPSLVVLGKGFTGGEYAASRLLFTPAMDTLPLFGALVTNGQEELASLAYLVTLRWAEANAEATGAVGERFEARLRDLAGRFPGIVRGVDGRRHLCGIWFHDLPSGKAFCQALNERGLDISVQTYKDDCPPSALTKLPLIAGCEAADFVIERMEEALARVAASPPRAGGPR